MRSDPSRRDVFETIAAEVFEPLQRYLRRRADDDVASEAFSDTLLTLWRRLDDVPKDDPLPWSYGVARRCLANQRRRRDRRLRLVDKVARLPPTPDSDPQAIVADDDGVVARALGELSEHDAEIVHLWAWEQLEPREIAIALDLTPNAVSVALSRSKRIMRSALDRQDPGGAGQKRDEADIENGRSEP